MGAQGGKWRQRGKEHVQRPRTQRGAAGATVGPKGLERDTARPKGFSSVTLGPGRD